MAKKKTETRPIFKTSVLFEKQYFGKTEAESSLNCRGNCDGLCRCSTITNAHIVWLDAASLVRAIVPKKLHSTILGYCAERVLRIRGACNKDNWDPNIVDGYYGQETDGATLDPTIAEETQNHLKKLILLSDARRMEYTLKLEYGYVLPSLAKKKWIVCTINRMDVHIGQEDYYDRKLDRQIVESYENHRFPIAICLYTKKYRLVDGHHRFAANTSPQISIVVAH